MKVTQEKRPASQVSLTIEVSPDQTSKTYEDTLKQFARSMRFPGFRQGKAPRHIIVQQIGPLQLKTAAMQEVMDRSLQQALREEKIEPAGQPKVTDSETALLGRFEPGNPFEFTVTVDVIPSIALPPYRDLTIQAETADPDLGRIDRLLEQQRVQAATLLPVEGRAAAMGDVVTVTYAGELLPVEGAAADADKGIDVSGLNAEDFQVALDTEKFLPDFVAGIVGMNVGESKEVPVTFPADYARPELAGRQVLFSITLKDIKERELPPLDDEFIQSISDYKSLEKLRSDFEARYRDEAAGKTEVNKERALLKALVTQLEVDLPESLVIQQLNSNVRQALHSLQEQGLDIDRHISEELLATLRETARPEAVFQVKADLLVREIGRQEGLDVDAKEVKAEARRVQAELESKADLRRLESVVYEQLFRNKVMHWLKKHNSFELLPPGSLPAEPVPELSIQVEDEEGSNTPAIDAPVIETEAIETEAIKTDPKKS